MANPTTNYQLPTTTPKPRVALVHDWFVGWGAESVVEQLHKMYPDAPIYTSYCNDEWRKRLNGIVVTGYLQKRPFPSVRKFVPFLRGWWFSHLDLSSYDLVISSSGAEAKFINVGKNSNPKRDQTNYQLPTTNYRNMKRPLHIAYIHAPTHYYWSRYEEYLKHPGFGFLDSLARLGLKILVGPMRRWDYRAAQRPDALLANSNYTKEQIKKYYNRDSTVIHPPVNTKYFSTPSTNYHLPTTKKGRSGFVITGRHTPYKRFDLAVATCTKHHLPLTVIGEGPETKKLISMAGPTIKFLGRISHDQLCQELQKAEAFIFPGVDDFGIAAVEALASGTPVIAYGKGGALDYVNKKTGVLFQHQTVDALYKAITEFQKHKFNHSKISQFAEAFSEDNFNKKFKQFISEFTK